MIGLLIFVREAPTGPVFGLFCAIAAIVMASQTISTYRRGFMYCGRTDRAYRAQDPKRFRLWLIIQTIFVVALASFSLYGFLA
jgi:hypothetical protein